MLQPDNEADTFEYCYEDQLGLGTVPGLFQEYLEEKYQDIDRLNGRWNSDYDSFEQAGPIMSPVDLQPDCHVRYLDFVKFRADYINQCVRIYANMYRENSIDVPLLHNTYDILSVQDYQGISEEVDLVGVDAYPSDQFAHKAFATGEQISHQRLQEVFRCLRTFSDTAYIAEYESGVGHGLHYYSGVLFPNQYTLTFLTAVQAGIHAWNWYMLVNRDNWLMCPINEWGRKHRELFRVFAENIELYNQMKVPLLEKMTKTSALFYLDHQVFPDASVDPVLKAIYDAGVDYEFYNLKTGQISKSILFYCGPNWLPMEMQERLLSYVEEGGKLVFFQTFPLYDETHQKANVLGLARPRRVTNEPFLDHLATETEVNLGDSKVRTRAPFFVYDGQAPGEPIYGTRVDADIRDSDFEENRYLRSLVIGRQYQVGYSEKRGAGSITVVGIRPSAAAVRAVHDHLGMPIMISSSAAAVKPALFRGESAYFAVLINLADHPVQTTIDLSPALAPGDRHLVSNLRRSLHAGDLESGPFTDGRFHIVLPRKNGTVVEIRRE
jgi:hypothetical protein